MSSDDESVKLFESKAILAKLRSDIKQISVEALKEVNFVFFQLNRVVHESSSSRDRGGGGARQRVKRSVQDVHEMGLNLTIQAMDESQRNFKSLLDVIAALELELDALLGGGDASALDECQRFVDSLKTMLARHENHLLGTIHTAILDLNERLASHQSDTSSSSHHHATDGGTATRLQLEQLLSQQLKLTANIQHLLALHSAGNFFYFVLRVKNTDFKNIYIKQRQ